MFEWIKNNIATLLIVAGLAAAVVLIIIKLVRDKKRGAPVCGCGCAHCAMSSTCHPRAQSDKTHDDRKSG